MDWWESSNTDSNSDACRRMSLVLRTSGSDENGDGCTEDPFRCRGCRNCSCSVLTMQELEEQGVNTYRPSSETYLTIPTSDYSDSTVPDDDDTRNTALNTLLDTSAACFVVGVPRGADDGNAAISGVCGTETTTTITSSATTATAPASAITMTILGGCNDNDVITTSTTATTSTTTPTTKTASATTLPPPPPPPPSVMTTTVMPLPPRTTTPTTTNVAKAKIGITTTNSDSNPNSRVKVNRVFNSNSNFNFNPTSRSVLVSKASSNAEAIPNVSVTFPKREAGELEGSRKRRRLGLEGSDGRQAGDAHQAGAGVGVGVSEDCDGGNGVGGGGGGEKARHVHANENRGKVEVEVGARSKKSRGRAFPDLVSLWNRDRVDNQNQNHNQDRDQDHNHKSDHDREPDPGLATSGQSVSSSSSSSSISRSSHVRASPPPRSQLLPVANPSPPPKAHSQHHQAEKHAEKPVPEERAQAGTYTEKSVPNMKTKMQTKSKSKASTISKKRGTGIKKIAIEVEGVRFITKPGFYIFWEYAAERHAVEMKRRKRVCWPIKIWTSDDILRRNRFCSVFRVADRGCQFLIKEVIERGSQEPEEILFRVLLYSSFVRVETYEFLEKELLGPGQERERGQGQGQGLCWKTYSRARYADALQKCLKTNGALYTSSFQKFPPKMGCPSAHENHLVLLEVMMNNRLLEKLQEAEYMSDAFDAIYAFPGSGDFIAYQLLLNLSYSPLLKFGENDFVIAGCGAEAGLKKCFGPEGMVKGREAGLIRWMMEKQEEMFRRVGVEPVYLVGEGEDEKRERKRKMTLVDVEHTLCEVQKYIRLLDEGGKKGSGRRKRFKPKTIEMSRYPTLPKAWNEADREIVRIKEGGKGGKERARKVFVVNGIVDKGVGKDGEDMYLVDWLGYGPEERTWEPAWVIREDAPEMADTFENRLGLKTLTDFNRG